VNKEEISEIWESKGEKIKIYEGNFNMNGVEQPLRYVKFAKSKSKTERSQMLIITTCVDMSLETLYKIIKARWEIENSIFNNLKNEASMGHCFVHGGNAVEAILYCIFIASNLFQLFKLRRINNHVKIQRELVRLLLKGLYLLKHDKDLIFNTT
jgi:predicted transposase YbfD/YdcC